MTTKPYKDIQHDGCQFHVYDNFSDFIDHMKPERLQQLSTESGAEPAAINVLQSRMGQSTKWLGGLDYQDTYKLAAEGQPIDPEMLEIRNSLTTAVSPIREQCFTWDVAGESVDIGAFMTGEPECMLTTEEREVHAKKVINVVFHLSASAAVSEEALRMQGIAMMALVDAIQNTNHYVLNLWFCNSVTGSYDGDASGSIMIKLADQSRQYDPQSLGYAITNVGMLRQMCFNYYLQLPKPEARNWYRCSYHGLGMPATPKSFPKELELDMESTIQGERWLLGQSDLGQIKNKESALRWVKERMETISE